MGRFVSVFMLWDSKTIEDIERKIVYIIDFRFYSFLILFLDILIWNYMIIKVVIVLENWKRRGLFVFFLGIFGSF